jgi:serine/threonine protein kinase
MSVESLAEEFLERKRRGEVPKVAEYLARYPALADEILEFFPVLGLVEDFKPDGGGETTSRGGAGVPGPELPLERLGDYRILRVVGRGGMGVVYEAEQEALGRRVALKVMAGHAMHDPGHLARFTREAKAAARLHHTNIVPVFGVGEIDGIQYYVMQFIHGQGLDRVLEEVKRLEAAVNDPLRASGANQESASASQAARSLLAGSFVPLPVMSASHGESPALPAESVDLSTAGPGGKGESSLDLSDRSAYYRSVARIGLQVAEGLAYAHEQGVLHRDIKPSNVLLDAHGITWITDFGLAKVVNDSDLTLTGDIIGTVRYMAPERFHGHCDARSDVYALGLTLYELLARHPAFNEADRSKLIKQVTAAEPLRLHQLDPTIPRDLAIIVQKTIEHEPADRYQTAQALADDLSRFLEDRPISARPVSAAEQLWRWCRRNPQAASIAAVFVATLVTGLVVISLLSMRLWWVASERARLFGEERVASARAQNEADRAGIETRAARAANELASRRLYISQMNLAQRCWEDWNAQNFKRILDEQRPENQGGVDRRGWEWYYWQRKASSGQSTLRGHYGIVSCVGFSPDGSHIASASGDGTVRVWDVAVGREVLKFRGHDTGVRSLVFSPDRSRIASASRTSAGRN